LLPFDVPRRPSVKGEIRATSLTLSQSRGERNGLFNFLGNELLRIIFFGKTLSGKNFVMFPDFFNGLIAEKMGKKIFPNFRNLTSRFDYKDGLQGMICIDSLTRLR